MKLWQNIRLPIHDWLLHFPRALYLSQTLFICDDQSQEANFIISSTSVLPPSFYHIVIFPSSYHL